MYVKLASAAVYGGSKDRAIWSEPPTAASGVEAVAPGEDIGLRTSRTACASMPCSRFESALCLWRTLALTSGDASEIASAALPTDKLVFRARGRRGGRGHGFSSDEAKRAAGRGLRLATGLSGATADFHLDVLAQETPGRPAPP